jgi:large subunit ribosomal protein L25
MDQIALKADRRTVIGKKVSSLRRAGLLPAIIYGTGIEPIPLELPAHETSKVLSNVRGSTLINLEVGEENHTVILRDVQIDVIRKDLLHIDFLKVTMDEEIRTEVPIQVVGEAPAVKEFGGVLVLGISEIEVEALPADLPDRITVDLDSLEEINAAITVADIYAGPNVKVVTEPEEVIAHVVTQTMEEIVEEVEEEEAVVELAIEPEVVGEGEVEETEEGMEEEG